jgi:hydroxyethylthiazole kinase-like uncharacterized protein yjeF
VFVALLDPGAPALDQLRPELMFRRPDTLDLSGMTVVSGCGGGAAVGELLPHILQTADALVLDADALNGIAADPALQKLLKARSGLSTVLTPHPLEAARLLGSNTGEVQRNRLAAAQDLAKRFGAIVALKGSGTVIAQPDGTPLINVTGNARLATAGTGDVLSGMVGALVARRMEAFDAACAAVWLHGRAAELSGPHMIADDLVAAIPAALDLL